jgi:hypothetical protein
MRYDEYLANGWPIASGPVEGACKNLIKGMRQANPIYTAARVGDAVMGWTNKRRWYRSGGGGVAGKLSNWWPNTKPAG